MSHCQDIETCMSLIQSIVDGQESISNHFDFLNKVRQCTHCYEQFESDKVLKEMIRQHIAILDTPLGLEDLIRTKISQTVKA